MGDTLGEVVWWLVVLAAVDMGLMALANFSLVGLLDMVPMLPKIVHVLMGLAGVWMLVGKFKK